MALYCTTFYTQQRENEDRYPAADLASRIAYAHGQVATSQTTQTQLESLTPPPALGRGFAAFVANARQLLNDRMAGFHDLQTVGNDDAVGDKLNADFTARWPLAAVLGATRCDGALPADQQAAVVTAVRTYETSQNSAEVCRDLLTPQYLRTAWAQDADPVNGCIAEREAFRLSAVGLPQDIHVQTITGVEDIAATAHYGLVGGCGCQSNITRLHFVDGAWKISEREQ